MRGRRRRRSKAGERLSVFAFAALVVLTIVGLAFAAGYQTLMMVLLTGALRPWLGISPSPEVAAAFAATAPWCLSIFLHAGQPSTPATGGDAAEKDSGEPSHGLEAREELPGLDRGIR